MGMVFFFFFFVCVCVSQINCVLMKGLNDDELCDFVALTEKKVSVVSKILI